MKYLSYITLIFLLASCGNDPFSYRPISEFPIDQDALSNKVKVEFVYSSGGPATEDNQDFYYQYIVVDPETGDTVRVLTPSLVIGEPKGMSYLSIEPETMTDSLVINTMGFDRSQYTRVICNNEYADFESRKFPTVIGFFAFVSESKDGLGSDEVLESVKDSVANNSEE